jgi:hypothetical protein
MGKRSINIQGKKMRKHRGSQGTCGYKRAMEIPHRWTFLTNLSEEDPAKVLSE